MNKIRKEIHLPKELMRDLKMVAAYVDKSPKRYIEDLVIQDVKGQIYKIKK